MASTSAQLGPFTIDSFVGSGGMGDVYRAHHGRYGTDAAIKVLTAEHARRERFVRAFQQEVRALAKLDHPGIAAVFDHGIVTDGATEVAQAGAPWLAMEFVDGPVIPETRGIDRWSVLESILLSLLDALAHAHAHGVIHRDLKPGNVLVVEEASGEPEVRLLDFGIARVLEAEIEEEQSEQLDRVRGTPKYMAPEQILGEWRDQGPWTDLYAFGCLAWRLVSGRAPFGGETTEDVLKGHIRQRPIEFTPVMEVPEGLRGWLDRLLAKRPEERFRRAADAAFALMRLTSGWSPERVEPETKKSVPIRPDEQLDESRHPTLSGLEATLVDSAPTVVGETTPGSESSAIQTTPFDSADLSEISDGEVPAVADDAPEPKAPPVAEDWRRAPRSDAGRLRKGASLGLFGLRKIPMVDRDSERDRLWELLREVREEGRPRGILLSGPAASGKSRLAEWLSRRSHELGAATTLRATHTSNAEWSDGIGPMLDRFFRCAHLAWEEALERVQDRLAELEIDETARIHDAVGLTYLMGHRPQERPESFPGGFDTDRERNAAIRRVVRGLGRERGVILWLDDAIWGPDSLELARSIFSGATDGDLPVLTVMTARTEDLEGARGGAELIEEMMEGDELEELRVDPLAGADHRRLVERMLALEDGLAEEVAAHTEGDPLFATQLLRDWVDRDLLASGEQGYELRGTRASGPSYERFPANLRDLWEQRLHAAFDAIEGLTSGAGFRAVELAAALGRHVDRDEWHAVCEVAGLSQAPDIEGALVERGLAEGGDDGWYFIHAKLVAALRERAEEGGRWRAYHRICASALARVLPRDRDALLRRVEHLLQAEEIEAALDPLYDAAVNCAGAGRYREDNRLLAWRADLMDQLGLEESDRRRVQNRIGVASNLLHLGETDAAEQYLREAETHCRQQGWKRELARVLHTEALKYGEEGDSDTAIELLQEAATLGEEAGNERGRWEAEATAGWVLLQDGDEEAAQRKLREAVDHLDKEGRPGSIKTKNWLATTHLSKGEYAKAREILDELHEEIRRSGLRAAEVQEWNLRGEIARLEGDWDRAKRAYEKARDLAEQSGERNLAIVDMNIAMVEMASGRFRRAEREFERLLDILEEAGMSARLPRIRIGLAACAAGLEDWERFDERLEAAEQKAVGEGSMSYDDPWLAEFAAEHADEAGEQERARRAWMLVANLWKQAGNADEAAEAVERATPRKGS